LKSNIDSTITELFVHDAQWNPNGLEFAIIHGNMPTPKTTIFDVQTIKKADLMVGEARNKLLYDPTGRILCIGGFGSLKGECDFWNITQVEKGPIKLGKAVAFSSSYHAWSPCGKYFLASVQSPRMKVDNDVKIFDYNGHKIFEERRNDLYQYEWKNFPPNSFPLEALAFPSKLTTKNQEKVAEVYKHPHFTANKVPIGGKLVTPNNNNNNNKQEPRPQIGGQLKTGPKKKTKPKKKPQETKTTPVVIEEIEQPTFT